MARRNLNVALAAAAAIVILVSVTRPALARPAHSTEVEQGLSGEVHAVRSVHGRRLLQDGSWVLNPDCLARQPCSENGTCLRSVSYNSTTGCGANLTENVITIVTDNCRRAGCVMGACLEDEVIVNRDICLTWPPSFNELCCKKALVYVCRAVLQCSWRPAPSPPPPVASMAVFAAGGSWNGSVLFDRKVNAYIMAIFANTIYEDSVGAEDEAQFRINFVRRVVAPMGGLRTWVYYGAQGTEWAFIETPTSIIVPIRGTEGLFTADALISDLTSFLTDPATEFGGTNVRIGQGFYRAFAKNKDLFLSEFVRFKNTSNNPRKNLWLSGHSLGGALATLFGAYLQVNGHTVTGVYTFGSPIVGNAAWKAVYPLGNVTYRYEVPGDVVPRVPPNFDYEDHVGITTFDFPCEASVAAVTKLVNNTRRSMLAHDDMPLLGQSSSSAQTSSSRSIMEDAADSGRACSVARFDDLSGALFGPAFDLHPVVEVMPCGESEAAAAVSSAVGRNGDGSRGRSGLARRVAAAIPTSSPKAAVPTPSPKAAGPAPSPKAAGPTPSPKAAGPTPSPKAAGPTPSPKPASPAPKPGPVSAPSPKPSAQPPSTGSRPPSPFKNPGSAHSVLTSYTTNLYFCRLGPQQQAVVPSFQTVWNFQS